MFYCEHIATKMRRNERKKAIKQNQTSLNGRHVI